MAKDDPEIEKIVATNRKAFHDYIVIDIYEAGISLQGTEVKSCREGKVSLVDSFASIEKGEPYLYNMNISPYEKGNIYNHHPKRTRKLLMHRSEIRKLIGSITQKGFTLIPLRAYFKGGRLKIELALAKGKKMYDKREDMKKRDHEREMDRFKKDKRKY